MFWHNFKYTLKTLCNNKMLIFWTLAFPILMATFFQLAFANIENSESLKTMKIAVVDDLKYQQSPIWQETMQELSQEETQLFEIHYCSLEQAKELLENKDIIGYLSLTDKPKIVVQQNGIYQTVFKSVISQIEQSRLLAEDLIEDQIISGKLPNQISYQEIYQQAIRVFQTESQILKNVTRSNLSYTMIEFYTLIAMTCLYSGTLGMQAINQVLPNMGTKGMRFGTSPVKKSTTIISALLASYLIQLISLGLLFAYTILIFHIDYGTNLPLILLLSFLGSFAGLSFGVAIGSTLKTNENVKVGIIIAITMLWSFLSGMMGITMKYVIDKNLPFINKINPANLITDGFYTLYYYDTYTRYWTNILGLVLFTLIMLAISFIVLRRQKYDSL